MGQWKTWHVLERPDGSASLYYTVPQSSVHFVVYDTLDGNLKEAFTGAKARAEAAEAEVAALRAWIVAACNADHKLMPPSGAEIEHKVNPHGDDDGNHL